MAEGCDWSARWSAIEQNFRRLGARLSAVGSSLTESLQMAQLIARATYTYGGIPLRPGQRFMATTADAALLTKLRRATYATADFRPEPPQAPEPVFPEALEASSFEDAPVPDTADPPKRKRRRYRRRDLRADD